MSTNDAGEYYIQIDEPRFRAAREAYFKWKDLNTYLKSVDSRGLNMPDTISEVLGCYCLGFLWNRGKAVGDATNPRTGEKIEFKATSNYNYDLTSFGPVTTFDNLYFLRFDLENNHLFIYDLQMNGQEIGNVMANQRETVRDQQLQGRRPHVRIIDTIIKPNNLFPITVFDILNGHEVDY